MPIKYVYLYETRKLDFLDLLLERLQGQGFIPIVLNEKAIEQSTKYTAFINDYQHFSDNPYNFEVSCFARYFAILEKHKYNDASFIIADSDIFVSQNLYTSLNYDNNFFYGSTGVDSNGSESQISPHFSLWTYQLLEKFVDYVCAFYKDNVNTSYIKNYYEERKKRLGRTGISDMTLLYDWVTNERIPFINTNTVVQNILIDHNISASIAEDGEFSRAWGRKKIVFNNDKVYFRCKDRSGNKTLKEVCVIHFQGRYKKTLLAFYQKKYLHFILYSAFIWTGRNVRSLLANIKRS